MNKELLKEIEELNKYKTFVYLMWEFIDEIIYDKEHFIMTIKFNQLVLDTQEIQIFVEKSKADQMYEVFTLLEQENGIQQDEVQDNDTN